MVSDQLIENASVMEYQLRTAIGISAINVRLICRSFAFVNPKATHVSRKLGRRRDGADLHWHQLD